MKAQDRDSFRKSVFERDSYTCVVPGCMRKAVDAHHIIERALWESSGEYGGYLLDNGVSVCELHHKHAEMDFIPPQALRDWAGIRNIVLPESFNASKIYTKWGRELPLPTRQPWETVKYPHTPYLNFSPGVDRTEIEDAGYFDIRNMVGKPIVATIKMDGSNAMLTSGKVASRNGHDAPHPSFDMLKALHSKISDKIPSNIEIFGEWLYAKHSIHYDASFPLVSLFQVFAVYDVKKYMWASWNDVMRWAGVIGFPTVQMVMLDDGNLNQWQLEDSIRRTAEMVIHGGHEGIVVRSQYPFHYSEFGSNMAKYVRANHVQTDEHWSNKPIIRNVEEPK